MTSFVRIANYVKDNAMKYLFSCYIVLLAVDFRIGPPHKTKIDATPNGVLFSHTIPLLQR